MTANEQLQTVSHYLLKTAKPKRALSLFTEHVIELSATTPELSFLNVKTHLPVLLTNMCLLMTTFEALITAH